MHQVTIYVICIFFLVYFFLCFFFDQKIGHSIYGFQRKREYLEKLQSIDNDIINNDNTILNKFKKYILSKNILNLYQFLQESRNNEMKYILKNKLNIENLFNQYKWKKGYNLFKSMTSIS